MVARALEAEFKAAQIDVTAATSAKVKQEVKI